ncbi:hypothetical protein [Adhaeribacter terreus]|uniref:Lipoprotein n=1 Tax=Adhaeribacter terreus TaxID=529703 RepID=A0ABW0EDX4_9BACT
MKKITLPALALVASLAFSSCSQRLVDFTVISSKNHSLMLDKSQGKRVKASSIGPFGIGASIKDAMDKALQSAGPDMDLLVDGVVRVNNYFFVGGYQVEGLAVSSTKLRGQLGKEGFEAWCKANNVFDPNKAEVIAE